MLNGDQRRIYDRVMNHLHHHKQHDDGDCHCDIKPLRLFVSGVGGTGKSFLIEAIKLLVHWFGCIQCGWTDQSQALSTPNRARGSNDRLLVIP